MRRARFAHSGSKLINLAGFLVPQERSASRAESLLARSTVATRLRRDASATGMVRFHANRASFCKFDTAVRDVGDGNAGETAVVPRIKGRAGSGSLI